MKKIVFIIPYFGKFNNYFQLFLNSCKFNDTVEWLIFTDDKSEYSYPKNVKVHYMSFDQLKKKIANKFDFDISLENAYKLCDYRPAYGYIFDEYISNYDFWGYCDTDMIFGDIRKFFSDDVLNNNDKIGFFGHCSLIKNTEENNKLFMKDIDNEYLYKDVFKMKDNSSYYKRTFDEENNKSINSIFLHYNKKCNFNEYEANIYTKSSNFKLTRYNFDLGKYIIEKKSNSFFAFENGKIYRYQKKGNIIKKEEFLYIHMQSRPMKILLNDINCSNYKIIPNSFENLDYDIINIKNFKKIKIKNFNLHYFILRFNNLKKKIKKRVCK